MDDMAVDNDGVGVENGALFVRALSHGAHGASQARQRVVI